MAIPINHYSMSLAIDDRSVANRSVQAGGLLLDLEDVMGRKVRVGQPC